MAEETIIVVDYQAVSLKLVASVLRSEGYRVHLASTGEQALMMMNTTSPDLILTDLRLPGIDGLEFTRRVRAQPRFAKVPVVALSEFNSSEVESSAYEAGCDGFITKPIDTRSLASRVKAFLHQPADVLVGAEPEGMSPLDLLGPELEGLRRNFLTEATKELCRILESLNGSFDATAAARVLHQWVGAAGVLGYIQIAEKSRQGELLLGKPGWSKSQARELLTGLLYDLASPEEATETPLPDSILRQLDRKYVALIGFADQEADTVCAAFEKVRVRPSIFPKDEPLDSPSVGTCHVALIHVRPETMDSPWLAVDSAAPSAPPLVFVGARKHLLSLPAAVRARACEYLIDGWQPEEVVMRLSFAVSRAEAGSADSEPVEPKPAAEPPASEPVAKPVVPQAVPGEPPEILIADDDSTVRSVVQLALTKMGMRCRLASSGTEAMKLMQELCPNAMVLDVNMPGMDGFELLAHIRKNNLPIRVIMLTARQQEADVLRGFSLGADDYVVKPFNPLELVARLKRWI